MQNEDEPPFLKSLDQSGVPGFIQSLRQIGAQRADQMYGRLGDNARLFRDSLSAQLQIIEAQWEEQAHAKEEAEKLRGELDVFLLPQREELHRRQGAYHQYLTSEVPQRIKDMVSIASSQSGRALEKYMTKLDTTHWATLRASVKRGGRYQGASDVDLPTVFATRFEEPIADAWSKEILRDLRAKTNRYGKDCLDLANDLTEWAIGLGARVQAKEVKAQYEALQANAKKFETVGHDMAREMRDEARARLIEVIEKKIRQACTDFVAKNHHVGPGVKSRILELYRELAQEAASIAEAPARNLLQRLYRDAEREILAAFADFQDPLTPIAEAIVTTEEQRIARSDARRRKEIMDNLHAVAADQPALPSEPIQA